jgi:[ribosomal protein S5]-alanine N-acetyltransferase
MNRPPETFTTERLLVRRSRPDDARPILKNYAADPEVTRYLTWPAHPTPEWAAEYVRVCVADWEADISYRYEMCLLGTDNPIGGLRLRPEKTRVLFSYVMARPLWGRGLMSEALRFGVDWTLAQPGVFRAYAYCDTENLGSVRVMEKAGMAREGILRRWQVAPNIGPEPRDVHVCARVREPQGPLGPASV